jgi:ATP-binding cassette subfamily B protein
VPTRPGGYPRQAPRPSRRTSTGSPRTPSPSPIPAPASLPLLDRHFKDGAELSGGQWQRIAAARGFYRSAPLLIMDEPTAALDARAEYALFSSIRGHARDRSVLLITHRLASVRHADRIYVLRDGQVIEQGVHADLLALGGQYSELFTLQATQYSL